MAQTIGILLFDKVEELDFVGPWEVFSYATQRKSNDTVITISETGETISCAKGLRVIPDYSFESAPELDVILVPGGQGTRREINNPALINWIRTVAKTCTWVTSVCTGSLLLHEAGLVTGKRVTTYWDFVDTLRKRGNVTVLDNVRYVRDGNIVTSAGVSAGIDMSLWLLGQLYDEDYARETQQGIEYFPSPPYSAVV
jgi:transcriptional regulator GlxA family with amidase domain